MIEENFDRFTQQGKGVPWRQKLGPAVISIG
jgi:hypothetical protein